MYVHMKKNPVNPHGVIYQIGRSPVFAASHNGHTDIVDLLVQAGADIHLATTEVYTLIHTVSSSAVIVVVKLMSD